MDQREASVSGSAGRRRGKSLPANPNIPLPRVVGRVGRARMDLVGAGWTDFSKPGFSHASSEFKVDRHSTGASRWSSPCHYPHHACGLAAPPSSSRWLARLCTSRLLENSSIYRRAAVSPYSIVVSKPTAKELRNRVMIEWSFSAACQETTLAGAQASEPPPQRMLGKHSTFLQPAPTLVQLRPPVWRHRGLYPRSTKHPSLWVCRTGWARVLSAESLRSLPGSARVWDSLTGVPSLRSSTALLIADISARWTAARRCEW